MTWFTLLLFGCGGANGTLELQDESDTDADADADSDTDTDTDTDSDADADTDADTEPDVDTGTIDTGGANPGPVVFTEVMVEPVNGTADWVELQNVSTSTVVLDGYLMRVETSQGVLFHPLQGTVAPGELFLLASSDDGGQLPVDQVRPGLDLPSDVGLLRVIGPAGVEDTLFYDALYSTGNAMPAGASISLEPGVSSTADTPLDWCDGWSASASGDFGTPGEANESCDRTIQVEFEWVTPTVVSGTTDFVLESANRRANAGGTLVDVLRETTASGQRLTMTFAVTNATYTAQRPFGSDCFFGGEMSSSGSPPDAEGIWTVTACN